MKVSVTYDDLMMPNNQSSAPAMKTAPKMLSRKEVRASVEDLRHGGYQRSALSFTISYHKL